MVVVGGGGCGGGSFEGESDVKEDVIRKQTEGNESNKKTNQDG